MLKEIYRPAVFAVVYFRENEKNFYLLLKRKLHWRGWEFPKGGMKKGENEIQAVQRELKEETGLNVVGEIKKFPVSGKYKYDKKYPDRRGITGQTYSLYAVGVKKLPSKIKLDKKEHEGYEFAEFGDALKKLTWSNQRRCLTFVNNWLNKNE